MPFYKSLLMGTDQYKSWEKELFTQEKVIEILQFLVHHLELSGRDLTADPTRLPYPTSLLKTFPRARTALRSPQPPVPGHKQQSRLCAKCSDSFCPALPAKQLQHVKQSIVQILQTSLKQVLKKSPL